MSVKFYAEQFKKEEWDRYVAFCVENIGLVELENRNVLNDFIIPEDMKIVILYRLRDYAKEWFSKKLPAFDGIKPMDVVNSEEGKRAIKEVLLRMPD